MENLLDPTNQVETEPPEAAQPEAIPEKVEAEATNQPPAEESETSAAPQSIEEIDTAPKAQLAKALPGKPAPYKREEPPPNPLILDPYEWNRCTITVGYSLLPDKKVSVSVHNHKDDPIVREFPLEEVPLPEKINQCDGDLAKHLPHKPGKRYGGSSAETENTPERPIIASVRVSTDTPIVQEGVESNLPFPAPIVAMLEELKALMPERALKNIEKLAKAKTATPVKPTNKSATQSQLPKQVRQAPRRTTSQDQMKLF